MNLQAYILIFTAFVGIPALIAVLINIGKLVKLVKDGSAQTWAKWLNLVVFVGLFVVVTFFPDLDLKGLDALAQLIADLGIYVLALVGTGIGVSGKVNGALTGLPLIGYKHK